MKPFSFKKIWSKAFMMLAVVAITAGFVSVQPQKAQAFGSCQLKDPASLSDQGTSVPDYNKSVTDSVFVGKQKNCLLDSLAQAIAKVALQQMTSSIVGWINSGFKGNPAFPTDPAQFFLNTTDQIAGTFLHNIGMSGLCSPFSVDIRLSLALGVSNRSKLYSCSIENIIKNAKNGPIITINGKRVQPGMKGFLGGDFNQGGWPAFLALTTEPQNNAYGAYVVAQSDMNFQIAQAKASINLDLNRGGGILSWPKCTQVGQTDSENVTEQKNLKSKYPNATVKQASDGQLTYETCVTETPGSVIGASLNKQLGSSVDSVVSIHDINSALDQIAFALLGQILKAGLNSSSKQVPGSNQTGSLIQQLTKQEEADQLSASQAAANSSVGGSLESINTYAKKRSDTVTLITTELTFLNSAADCFEKKGDATDKSFVTNYISTNVTPLYNDFTAKYQQAQNAISQGQAAQSGINSATSIGGVSQSVFEANSLLSSSSTPALPTSADYSSADTDYKTAQTKAKVFHAAGLAYLQLCHSNAVNDPNNPYGNNTYGTNGR